MQSKMKELIIGDDCPFEKVYSCFLSRRDDNSKPIIIGIRGKCRFCGADSPKLFKKKAHVIPHSLGNSRLVSDDECDKCNQLFGKYDEQLFRFFAPYLSVAGLISDKKPPKIQDRKVSIQRKKGFFQNNDLIHIEHKEGRFPKFRLSRSNSNSLDFTLETALPESKYIPIFVYLSLCKQALNLLPINELIYFKNLLKALQCGNFHYNDDFPEIRAVISRRKCIGSNFLTNEKRCPDWLASILLKKKNDGFNHRLPKYIYMFALDDLLLQVPLPSDDWFIKDFISYRKVEIDFNMKVKNFEFYSTYENTIIFSGTEERDSPFNKLTINS
jgi:hypothetical protein